MSVKKLQTITRTVTEVDYNDLDSFVQKTYGWKDYEFVSVEECGNDSDHLFQNTDGNLDQWDLEAIEHWNTKGHRMYSNGAVLKKLVADGHLSAGDILVRVCW